MATRFKGDVNLILLAGCVMAVAAGLWKAGEWVWGLLQSLS